MGPHDDEPVSRVTRVRWDGRAAQPPGADHVAREEPLEIRIGGVSVAVVMRTPGHDHELARGFLVTERVVEHADQIVSVEHCTTVQTPEAEDNVVQVVLRDDVSVDWARLRRNIYASSSCGLCGKATIEAVMHTSPPLDDAVRVQVSVLHALPDRLRAAQQIFDATGGLHAAGMFTPDGEALVVREDIGRHNAVDKIIGWASRARPGPLAGLVLMVSGRISYEIAQKALAARVPVVAGVSAPSSLAIELAMSAGLTLAGFVRDGSLSVYAGADRINS